MNKAIELLNRKKETPIVGDPITKPSHYTWHALFECKELTRHLPFNEGNVIKYLYRSGFKGTSKETLHDRKKALQYISMMEDTPDILQASIWLALESFYVVIANRHNAIKGNTYCSPSQDYTLIAICAAYFEDIHIGQAFIEVMNTLAQHNLHDRTTLYDRVAKILDV